MQDSDMTNSLKGVVTSRLEVDPGSPECMRVLAPYAHCYRTVFGTDNAWREGWWCENCSTPGRPVKWKLGDEPNICPSCHGDLHEFWPVAKVIADAIDLLRKPGGVIVTATSSDGVVVGATCGFVATLDELDAHLNEDRGDDDTIKDVQGKISRAFPGVTKCLYLDEILVLPEYQRRGLGKQLFAARHECFEGAGVGACVMRTMSKPPSVTYQWYTKPGWDFQVIGAYENDSGGRVVLGQLFDLVPVAKANQVGVHPDT